jgi:hypothetical protein
MQIVEVKVGDIQKEVVVFVGFGVGLVLFLRPRIGVGKPLDSGRFVADVYQRLCCDV